MCGWVWLGVVECVVVCVVCVIVCVVCVCVC